MKYLWISKTSLASIGLKPTEKNFTTLIKFSSYFFHVINSKIF